MTEAEFQKAKDKLLARPHGRASRAEAERRPRPLEDGRRS
ncbi:hypothetical protein ACF05T_14720 [Streptomyces lateritius]|uniref:Uncharacterized protein n=1 Tax=Streptomyces lateritius TaxID=67313 RepID=A0ABW6YBY5_9ACTN